MDKLKALVCPMDWGLGHASRCVPVIRAFKKAGFRVVVATSGPSADLIKKEFRISGQCNEWLRLIPFPGFTVSYTRSFLFLNLLLQVPLFLYHIHKEKKLIRVLVERYKPDIIVSDNRYGLAHKYIKSVIITHQLRPSMPYLLKFIEGTVARAIRYRVRAFDECWIPDCPDNHAAGKLIKGWEKLPDAYFTGWLSRFTLDDRSDGVAKPPLKGVYRFRMMFFLSGPEPQRSILEEMIIEQVKDTGIKALLVRGLPLIPHKRAKIGKLEIVSYMDADALVSAVGESELIVCRSGYSSVMDMLAMGKSAVLIPTPGQTEQEYLGEWLEGKGWFRVLKQKDMDGGGLIKVLADMEQGNPRQGAYLRPCNKGRDLLQERVDRLVQELVICRKNSD